LFDFRRSALLWIILPEKRSILRQNQKNGLLYNVSRLFVCLFVSPSQSRIENHFTIFFFATYSSRQCLLSAWLSFVFEVVEMFNYCPTMTGVSHIREYAALKSCISKSNTVVRGSWGSTLTTLQRRLTKTPGLNQSNKPTKMPYSSSVVHNYVSVFFFYCSPIKTPFVFRKTP